MEEAIPFCQVWSETNQRHDRTAVAVIEIEIDDEKIRQLLKED